jgi:hypothetical protein
MSRVLHVGPSCFPRPAQLGNEKPIEEVSVSARGNERVVSHHDASPQAVACPKCGSGRTAVTVNVVDDSGNLTLYSCGTCDHRFSRTAR